MARLKPCPSFDSLFLSFLGSVKARVLSKIASTVCVEVCALSALCALCVEVCALSALRVRVWAK
jgi:hypothetical protein